MFDSTRRGFIKSMLLAGVAPFLLPSPVFGSRKWEALPSGIFVPEVWKLGRPVYGDVWDHVNVPIMRQKDLTPFTMTPSVMEAIEHYCIKGLDFESEPETNIIKPWDTAEKQKAILFEKTKQDSEKVFD